VGATGASAILKDRNGVVRATVSEVEPDGAARFALYDEYGNPAWVAP
jgi:hypothetical protein